MDRSSECGNAAPAWHTHTHALVAHSISFDICSQLFRRKCFPAAPNSEIKIVKNWVILSGLGACPLFPQLQRTTMRSIDDESLLDHTRTHHICPMSNAGLLSYCGGRRVRMRICCSCRSSTLSVYGEWLMTLMAVKIGDPHESWGPASARIDFAVWLTLRALNISRV